MSQIKDQDINQVKKIRSEAEIVYGVMAAEPEIKKLSKSGQLSNYRIIYFSTKGIIVPEIPEIGTLVVSNRKNEGEDKGLLNVNEISDLSLRADMVFVETLCIPPVNYNRGEGIGNFCNAFFTAGALSVSTSLWQVDESAMMLFMQQVYHRSLDNGMPFDIALTMTKRSFIKGLMEAGNNEKPLAGSTVSIRILISGGPLFIMGIKDDAGPRKKALIDSSSAILLFKSCLLEKTVMHYNTIMTESVFEELTRGRPRRFA